jgi:hypothetical protein
LKNVWIGVNVTIQTKVGVVREERRDKKERKEESGVCIQRN